MFEEELLDEEVKKKKRRVLILLMCLLSVAVGGLAFVGLTTPPPTEVAEVGDSTPTQSAPATLTPQPTATPETAGDETPVAETGASEEAGEEAADSGREKGRSALIGSDRVDHSCGGLYLKVLEVELHLDLGAHRKGAGHLHIGPARGDRVEHAEGAPTR